MNHQYAEEFLLVITAGCRPAGGAFRRGGLQQFLLRLEEWRLRRWLLERYVGMHGFKYQVFEVAGITRQVNSCAKFCCCADNWCTLLPSITHPGPVCPLCSPGGRNRGYCNDAIKGGYADDSCNPHDVYYNELGGLDDTPISWSSPVSVDPSSTDDWLSSVGAYEGGEGRESKSERKREGEREISVARSALDIFQV